MKTEAEIRETIALLVAVYHNGWRRDDERGRAVEKADALRWALDEASSLAETIRAEKPPA